jgi:aerobic carbon-monoxide dehydrogenase medium subunit
MYAFTYHCPTSLRQVASLFASAGEAKFLAGGHTLLPTMKQRLAAPQNLIDLSQVPELRGIERSARAVTIGAMTPYVEIETSADVKAAIPALAEMTGIVGDPHVRARGTIGGSVANNDPSADYPAACLALGTTIHTNKRKIAADDFFDGLFTTALDEGEIITKIAFPIPARAAYAKFRNPASRYALAGVFVAKRAGEVRVAVTGAGSNGVFRWNAAEEALKTRFAAKSLEGLPNPSEDMISDIHADATYRAHLVGVMARRAVQAATARASESAGADV